MSVGKGVFLSFITMCISIITSAQIVEPVKWTFTAKTLSETEAEISATAKIDGGWHVYALKVSDKADAIGPIPTSIKLDKSSKYEALGKPSEGKYITHYDPNFEMDLNYFENTAVFKQKIKIKSQEKFKCVGTLEYMACNDEKCIFPDPELFEVVIQPMAAAEGAVESAPATDNASTTPPNTNQSNTYKESHVTWTPSIVKVGDHMYELQMKATMEPGWHIYGQKVESNEGPVPTTFSFEALPSYSLNGSVLEDKPKSEYDPNFMMNLNYFEGSALFRQVVQVNGDELPTIVGSVNFMQCYESCLPPQTLFFKFDLAQMTGVLFDPLENEAVTAMSNDPFKMASVDLNAPINDCGQEKANFGLWAIFLFGLIGGLLALLTPCVFPMIPLTVSYFTKGAHKENGKAMAVMYGLFIFLIYFLLSLPFHLTKNVDPAVLNQIATNVWLNLGFFIIFVVFAISFFGFFELTLPSSLANKADNASNLGGLLGIFFMALTLAIVSFSCTGPILGSVLGSIYSDSDQISAVVNFLGMELALPAAKVSAAMAGFGLALGGPFAVFAAFPSLLKKLPKSGGWMDDFKVSLGFLELGLAVKFISNADLVSQWGVLLREVFFGIWILLGALWAAYLLGLYRFKPGQGSKGMSKTKLIVTAVVIIFTIRFVPGVMNHEGLGKMKFLSGFPPPWTYSFYERKSEFETHNNQLNEALKLAKEQNKPVFLDFTGWACVNCRKMEENVWPEPEVRHLLDSNFVMCSLYVDEKTELPADQQFIYETAQGRKKRIQDVGDRWATLQTETFNNNSQPFYALLTPDGVLLTPPSQYTPDSEEYAEWLKCGLDAYTKSQASAKK
ncbi:MAG: thioredoxin family protein [Flavobacteriales bacterium]|nr:thioredoxin family protein [Flavobacteriales bacterium]